MATAKPPAPPVRFGRIGALLAEPMVAAAVAPGVLVVTQLASGSGARVAIAIVIAIAAAAIGGLVATAARGVRELLIAAAAAALLGAVLYVLGPRLWASLPTDIRAARALVATGVGAWYLGISCWLLRGLEHRLAGRPHVVRWARCAVVVTAILPALIFFGVPHVHAPGPSWARWWLLGLAVPATVATLAVISWWLFFVLVGCAAFAVANTGSWIAAGGVMVVFAAGACLGWYLPSSHKPGRAGRTVITPLTVAARTAFLVAGITLGVVSVLSATHRVAESLPPTGATSSWTPRSDVGTDFAPHLHLVSDDSRPCLAPACPSTPPWPVYLVVRPVPPLPHSKYLVARHTHYLAAFWIFYPDDVFQARTTFGTMTQQHVGDWERVYVGFDVDGPHVRPLWFAYSSHCGGNWAPWSEAPLFDGEHMQVWVGKGSHANYPSQDERSPNWASCIPPAWLDTAVGFLSFSAGVDETMPTSENEVTGDTVAEPRSASRGLLTLRPVGAGDSVTYFGWHLGGGDGGVQSPLSRNTDLLPEIFAAGSHWHCVASSAHLCTSDVPAAR